MFSWNVYVVDHMTLNSQTNQPSASCQWVAVQRSSSQEP